MKRSKFTSECHGLPMPAIAPPSRLPDEADVGDVIADVGDVIADDGDVIADVVDVIADVGDVIADVGDVIAGEDGTSVHLINFGLQFSIS